MSKVEYYKFSPFPFHNVFCFLYFCIFYEHLFVHTPTHTATYPSIHLPHFLLFFIVRRLFGSGANFPFPPCPAVAAVKVLAVAGAALLGGGKGGLRGFLACLAAAAFFIYAAQGESIACSRPSLENRGAGCGAASIGFNGGDRQKEGLLLRKATRGSQDYVGVR